MRREDWQLGEDLGRPFQPGRRGDPRGAAGDIDPPRGATEIFTHNRPSMHWKHRVRPGEEVAPPTVQGPNVQSTASPDWMRAPLETRGAYFKHEHDKKVFRLSPDGPLKCGRLERNQRSAVSSESPDFFKSPFASNEQTLRSLSATQRGPPTPRTPREAPRTGPGLGYPPEVWFPWPSGMKRSASEGCFPAGNKYFSSGPSTSTRASSRASSRGSNRASHSTAPTAGMEGDPNKTTRMTPLYFATWRSD